MNAEPPHAGPTLSSEESDPLLLPLILTTASSSLKPLRERNRTNLKRRINLSRSQVLSTDFENEDDLSTANNLKKTTATPTAITKKNSQTLSTPTIHTHTELYSKTISPRTPSPIHTTVTCSQVWERLASNEEHQTSTSPKPTITPTTSTSSLPTHISFSYDSSDNEDDREDLPHNDKDDFQYVPVSSQSKLVQFQFLAFARQQQLNLNSDDEQKQDKIVAQNLLDSDEDDEDEQQEEPEHRELAEDEEQENRKSKKRKRSISTVTLLDDITALSTANNDTNAASSVSKPPCTKKPKIKDPNANFQRLNMKKKHFAHGKKHQFGKNKRNAFYRRSRYAGGNK
ncbi:unnamed protein product [Rotaria socialis]|uniref:Uncharacterized protein n=1 Tax=Rotaria socialis TaxID=392032 RepID=A0A817TFC9_9BILA|nr:unnamed protein product [Rotaria socialis]CAF3311994.1 unnamed protein product [Rotaria socialis]CAF3609965.1 unnamed protein product [Rotaria socialis]CAF3708032.1 unnamed protein product [Rotaria socialis]CAF3739691.1 unnamed protein product [Rotaria socialis]